MVQPDASTVSPSRNGSTAPRRRRFDRGLVIASIVLATGLVLIGYAALNAVTGDERTSLPEAIERISPLPDAVNVPNQSAIVVDLADGYTGRLIVDGQVFDASGPGALQIAATLPEPGVQVVRQPGVAFDAGTNVLQLTPGDEIGIPRWSVGLHLVTVEYWPIVAGPAESVAYRWQFTIV